MDIECITLFRVRLSWSRLLSPGNIDVVLHDSVRHSHGQVKDGIFVRLDRFSGVDDEYEGRVEHLVVVPALALGLAT